MLRSPSRNASGVFPSLEQYESDAGVTFLRESSASIVAFYRCEIDDRIARSLAPHFKATGEIIARAREVHEAKPKVKDLDSYLNDHLAGSVAALELIAHCAHLNKGKRLGVFFGKMYAQIAADQNTLRDLMSRLSIEESKVRQAGAWAGEKLGRALMAIAGNEADGLGLLLALEGLIMGIVGKGLLWRELAAANLSKLENFDFEKLRRRATEQIRRAQAEQVRSARRALVEKGLWRGDS